MSDLPWSRQAPIVEVDKKQLVLRRFPNAVCCAGLSKYQCCQILISRSEAISDMHTTESQAWGDAASRIMRGAK